jgi:hypothetical protein
MVKMKKEEEEGIQKCTARSKLILEKWVLLNAHE